MFVKNSQLTCKSSHVTINTPKDSYLYSKESVKMKYSYKEIPRLIDISAVRTDVSYSELKLMAQIAEKYDFVCVFAMPALTKQLRELITKPSVMVGGVAGFPSGGDLTELKVADAKKMVELGCNEVDMVINVSALLSGDYEAVEQDIKAVVDAVKPTPVKAILEIAYLTDEQIAMGSKLAVNAGVTFVKSGTGWAQKPTTVDTIKIMSKAADGKAKIKAAGGVRSLAILEEMTDAGCTRFGISLKSALSILKEAYERDGVEFPDSDLLENFDAAKAAY